MNNEQLQEKVLEWAEQRGILKPENALKQFAKCVSEIGELGDAIVKGDVEEMVDGLGDAQVTLIILCAQLGFNYDKCLETAYSVIAKRTGKTSNGIFIKD